MTDDLFSAFVELSRLSPESRANVVGELSEKDAKMFLFSILNESSTVQSQIESLPQRPNHRLAADLESQLDAEHGADFSSSNYQLETRNEVKRVAKVRQRR